MHWKTLLFTLILILVPTAKAQILINEIMADPIDGTHLNEWIELYNNGTETINISGWIIGDNSNNDTLSGGFYNGEGTLIPAMGYAIVTGSETRVYNNFNCSRQAIKLYVEDDSIGSSGLNNDGEIINLYNSSGELIDIVTYNAITGGKSWLFYNGSWWKGNTSCGYENYAELPNECDYSVNAITNQTVYSDGDNFEFSIYVQNIYGEKTNVTITKKITNLYGETVKNYDNITHEITSHATYSYTPNLDPGSYVLTSTITTNCTDTNLANNQDSELFIIQDQPRSNESYVKIETIYDLGSDDKAKFGQTIRVKINIYKTNTTKYSITMWMQDSDGNRISKESKTNTYTEYTNYTLTLPLQINPNCESTYPNKEYILELEGLDSQDTRSIMVEGITEELCEKVYVQKSTTLAQKSFTYELLYLPEKIKEGEKFGSKLKITNNEDNNATVDVSSYVYRGSKAYSGDREENKKTYEIRSKSTKTVELTNKVEEAVQGLYNYKIKIIKNKQKTPYEITRELIIEPAEGIDAKITSANTITTKEGTNLTIKIKNFGKEIKELKIMTDTLLENKTTTIDLKKNEEKQLTLKLKQEKTRNAAFIILYKDKVLDYKKVELAANTKTDNSTTKEETKTTQTLSGKQDNEDLNSITGMTILSKEPTIIYESTTNKAKNTAMTIVAILSAATLVFIMWKKEL